jgi:two-component system, NarL family, response regulator NreC
VCVRAHRFTSKTLAPYKKIRCALLHDHVLLRQGLTRLLEDQPDIEVVTEASTAAEALQRIFDHRPEVVIVDPSVFGSAPDQVERLILRESPASKVLFLTMRENGSSAGGGDMTEESYGVRETSAQQLVEAVRRTHGSKNPVREISRDDRRDWIVEGEDSRKRSLTSREREVLKLLVEGRTVRSAAAVLGLSVKTVDAHKFNLMRKLGIHNKTELVMWAIQKRVIKVPVNF